MMRKFFKKLDRLLTAIAHAEAGNLDAVKALLEQDGRPAKKNTVTVGETDTVQSAAILDFKLAEAATLQKPCSAAKLGALS
jgi:hypothetical protein